MNKSVSPHPLQNLKEIVAWAFKACGIAVGLMYLPQTYNVITSPETAWGISLVTFGFFFFSQFIATTHGIFQKDKTLIIAFSGAMIGSGSVVVATLIVRYMT